MAAIKLFPGVLEIPVIEDEPEPAVTIDRLSDLLARWAILGEELKRRIERPLPFDLALELHDLLDESTR